MLVPGDGRLMSYVVLQEYQLKTIYLKKEYFYFRQGVYVSTSVCLCVCVCFAELHTNHLADSHQTFWRCIAWAKKEPYIFGGKQFSFYIGFVGGLCSLSVC